MPDIPTPPKPPTPKAAAKGITGLLKGRNKWVLVAGFTVLAGVAYLAWKRGTEPVTEDEEVEPLTGDLDDLTSDYGPVAGVAGDYTSPAPTQGAFGGYDSPAGMDGGGTTINVMLGPDPLGDASDADPVPPASVTPRPAVTGGGHPPRNPALHHGPSRPATGHKKKHHHKKKKRRKIGRVRRGQTTGLGN